MTLTDTRYRLSFRPPGALCPSCGHDRTSLLNLPRVGTQSNDGEVILLVNEPCGTTRAVVLVPHRDDVLARLCLDSEEPLARIVFLTERERLIREDELPNAETIEDADAERRLRAELDAIAYELNEFTSERDLLGALRVAS